MTALWSHVPQICGLESSARATANSKCPENRDAFQSCFLWQKPKVQQLPDSSNKSCQEMIRDGDPVHGSLYT